MNYFPIAVYGAVLIAMGGATFGFATARIFFADDLYRAQHLQIIWDETKTALQKTIDTQTRTIELLTNAPKRCENDHQ